jgi:acetoin:2,6-dichlorophenolindophenol oxidoreductase subunit beta
MKKLLTFPNAIDLATVDVLKSSKRNLLFGLEVTNQGSPYVKARYKQVYETPVSELSSTGLVVGLSTQKYNPTIVYGRVEFALLAFDQIFTQASRWNYMFDKKSKCKANFRIQIGRQWGNGPQHTANYHSIFLQSLGLDVYIPSTPEEAFYQIKHMNKSDKPCVMLEHRYLSQITQKFDIKKKNFKINNYKFYKEKKKSDIILITYADTFYDALLARKFLRNLDIDIAILNLSYFPSEKRISENIFKILNNYKSNIYVESAPKSYSLLSGVLAENMTKISKVNSKNYFLASRNSPAPANPKGISDYYTNKNDIIKLVSKIKKRNIKTKKLSFEESVLWPNIRINDLI